MWRRIRELDFADIVEQIRRATNQVTRTACHSTIQADLAFVKSRADAADTLRDHVELAALDHAKGIEDIREDDPLVQAFVRAQHHPDARPLPPIKVQGGLAGEDAAPRLRQIVANHPELAWNPDAIQQHLIAAILAGAGDAMVNDELPPWQISWEPMGAAAYALMTLITLRTLAEL
jgi:hypothetical protein